MDFAPNQRTLDYLQKLGAFMAEEILPAENVYAGQLAGGADWRQWR